jgi:hypothetical protein
MLAFDPLLVFIAGKTLILLESPELLGCVLDESLSATIF